MLPGLLAALFPDREVGTYVKEGVVRVFVKEKTVATDTGAGPALDILVP